MLVDARHHALAQEIRRVLGLSSETAELRVSLAVEAGPSALMDLVLQALAHAPPADPTSFLAAPGEERPARHKAAPPGPPSPPPPPRGNKVG